MTPALHAIRRRVAAAGVAALCCVASALLSPALAGEVASEQREIAAATLPHEAHDVLARIRAGGPFRFERDGVTLGNR